MLPLLQIFCGKLDGEINMLVDIAGIIHPPFQIRGIMLPLLQMSCGKSNGEINNMNGALAYAWSATRFERDSDSY